MFALIGWENVPETINLKCDLDRAIRLNFAWSMIDDSYDLIVTSLPKIVRRTITGQEGA